MMNITKIIFSPTGGTDRIVNAILYDNKSNEKIIDLMNKDFNSDDISIDCDSLVIIALPSYSGRAPKIAMRRLKRIAGNNAKCVLVVSYGNRDYEDTLIEMYDTAVKCGFVPIAAISGIAEHSIDREIAKGRPDSIDREILSKYGNKIIASVDSTTKLEYVPGNRPYKELPTGSNCPQANESCVKCGKCKANCPVEAIDNHMNGDPQNCISCMRCIAVCPVASRNLDDNTRTRIHNYLQMNCKVRKEPELFMN